MIMENTTIAGESASGGGGGIDITRDLLSTYRAIETTSVPVSFLQVNACPTFL